MKRIIGVDIDGVLADFNAAFIALVVKVTGRDLFPARPFDIPCWDYPTYFGYTKAEQKAVWAVVENSETFWSTLPLYEDTGDSMTYLRGLEYRGYDVYFVTSRPGATAKVQTEAWLRCYGFARPTVLISGKKGYCARALNFDAYIDDRWENCVDVAHGNTNTYLMDRSWNVEYDAVEFGIRRVFHVSGFADLPVARLEPTPAL